MLTMHRKYKLLVGYFAFISAIAIAPTTQAKIYSWVDEDGKTHFSDIAEVDEVQEIDVDVASSNLSLEVQERKAKKSDDSQSQRDSNQRGERSEQSSSDSDQDRRPPPPDGDMQESGERR